MTASLDRRIRATLERIERRQPEIRSGTRNFVDSDSARQKAERVIATVAKYRLDPARVCIVSVGGADGTEMESFLKDTACSHGYLLEYDDDLGRIADGKARLLEASGKHMRVFIGDAVDKIDKALKEIRRLRDDGQIDTLVVSTQAVLHELAYRGANSRAHSFDMKSFLSKFTQDLPTLVIVREPCVPPNFPKTVCLSANCSPILLAKLAAVVRGAHPDFFRNTTMIQPLAGRVRIDGRLALETIFKLFYLESYEYEIEEITTSLDQAQILECFGAVFGDPNVRYETSQSDSFDAYWQDLGISLSSDRMETIPKPQLHISIVAKYDPFPLISSARLIPITRSKVAV